MARDPDHLAGSLGNENTGGLLTGFLAEEDEFDRRSLWRIGSWGAVSVTAVIVAMLASQSSIGFRRDQVAAADLVRQSQQIQSVAKESQNEARRLASAIETLNGDRDRLYSRVTVLEQGLDSVTGALARQTTVAPVQPPPTAETQPAAQNPAPVVSPVATTAAAVSEKPRADAAAAAPAPATVASISQGSSQGTSIGPAATLAPPLMAAKSIMAPPDPAASKLIEPENPNPVEPAKPMNAMVAVPKPDVVASAPSADDAGPDASQAAPSKVAVQRTEFGVDVGGANSVGGLRALWRGLLKSRSNAALTTLRPIIVIREGSGGFGMQLRLVAGPLSDAAAAAKICAAMIENERPCETTVFEGQRLAMKSDAPAAAGAARRDTPKSEMSKSEMTKSEMAKPETAKPVAAKPVARRRSTSKRVANDEPPKKPDPPSTLSSFFSRR
jgi:hypothetical protein